NSDGTYSFTNLGPGNHNIAPTTPSGWTMTTPGSGGIHNLTTGGCTGVANCVTFTSGDTVHPSGRHFGFFHNVAVSGVAFEDLNGNGVKDSNDPVLPNWTVKLDSSGSQLTGSDGSYSFANVGPGSHSVSEILQSAWIQTA